VIKVIVELNDIEGIKLCNIGGNVVIKAHDKDEIEIICNHENKLDIKDIDGVLSIAYNKEDTETIKKTFIEKIFKRSFKLNLPCNSSYVEDKDSILVYHLLMTEMEIYVPKSTINYIYIDGNLRISGEGFSDYVKVYVNGNNTVDLENIKNVYIDSQGKVECFLRDLYNASVYTNGGAYVRINSESMHSLKLKSKGEAQIDFVGKINELSCDISGICNVDIFGKVERKDIKKKGICKVSIIN
jgi:hypothetical protein